jgi:eukaryotic-like serine/threonine-protein kinase
MSSAVESLGKYVIRRQLGRGAMGTVYEGFDPVIERIVAIKTVRLPEAGEDDETAEEIARFRREAQAAGRLIHPNIVGVFDYGETADLAYIVMEYVDGPPLKSLLDKNERFPLPRVVAIMEDLLAGLQFSHERGVVHRDIKPANLMLTQSGRAKIADFGIARIESSSMTQAGTVLGTPAYMSPEQFMGQVVDARSDIYSAGVLLYQLLTGERPFDGSMSAIMHKALNTEAPAPSEISVTAPRPFDAVVRRAMAKRPENRYTSANEFMAAIRAAVAAPPVEDEPSDDATMIAPQRAPEPLPRDAAPVAVETSAAPPSRTPPGPPGGTSPDGVSTPAPKSSRLPLLLGGGAGVLAVLGGIGYFVLFGGAPQPAVSPAPPAVNSTPPEAPRTSGRTSSTPAPTSASTPAPSPAGPTTSAPSAPGTKTPIGLPPAKGIPPATTPGISGSSAPGASTTTKPTPGVSGPTAPPANPGPVTGPAPTTPSVPESPSTQPRPPVAVAPPPAAARSPTTGQPPATPSPAEADATARSEVASFVAGLSCSMFDGDARGGNIQVKGLGDAAAIDRLRAKLSGGDLGALTTSLNVTRMDPRFCSWLDLLRPFEGAFGDGAPRLGLWLADDPKWLVDGDDIRPRLTMAGFRGYIYVDYLDRDGNVMHLYPRPADPQAHIPGDVPRAFTPGEPLALGEHEGNFKGWQVGEPFGTDMIVAVASADPLFARPRASIAEQAAAYMKDLRRALERAEARGSKLAAIALPVETRRR